MSCEGINNLFVSVQSSVSKEYRLVLGGCFLVFYFADIVVCFLAVSFVIKVRSAQLAKSTILISTLVPLGSFKVCSDAKERGVRKATERYRTYSCLVKLQLWFLSLRWKTCLWAELQPSCLSFQ